MISLILLLKIVGGICFIASWVFMYRSIRRTEGRLECLREHCEERLTVMAESMELMGDIGQPDDDDLAETKRKALEAERRFTEGIASILNFSYGETGKKGE